jgi:hypothetical protein
MINNVRWRDRYPYIVETSIIAVMLLTIAILILTL